MAQFTLDAMATKASSSVLKRDVHTGRYVLAVPRSVRDAAGLKEGDAVIFTTTRDGRTIMTPKTGSLRDLRGVVATKVHLTDKEIKDSLSGRVSSKSPKDEAAKFADRRVKRK
jgi:bifunctional DNA-binding transcriptional regulator/antitoxin component of YhaV-PrlF toxin-antitoxin module